MRSAFVGGLAVMWIVASQAQEKEPWIASAEEVRKGREETWQSWMFPPPGSAVAILPDFSGVRVETGQDEVAVSFPNPGGMRGAWGEGLALLQCDGAGVAHLPGGGEARVVAMASSHRDREGKANRTPRWRRPGDGKEISPDEIEAELGPVPGIRDKMRVPDPRRGNEFLILIHVSGAANPLWMNRSVFDGRTHVPTMRSGTGAWPNERAWITRLTMPVWHDGPLVLVADLAWGEFEERSMPAEAGSEVDFGHLRGRLVHLADGHPVGASFGYEDPGLLTVRLQSPEGPGCIAICAFVPKWRADWCDVGFRDRAGNWFSSRVGGQHYIGYGSFKGLAADVAREWVVRSRPEARRIVFQLPGFPDLPNRSGKAANLFEMRIPWVKFENRGEMTEFLGEATQLTGFSVYRDLPARADGVFPIEFRDATVADIARKLVEMTGRSFEVDPVELRIRLSSEGRLRN